MIRPVRSRSTLSLLAAVILLAGAVSLAHAQGGVVNNGPGDTSAPEIDPSMVGGGLALLGGTILVLRGRYKR